MGRERIKRQKQRLFIEQDGRCYYCGCEMVMPEGHTKRQPANLATLEHLDDRFSPLRGKMFGQRRHVLACVTCNGQRGRAREIEVGIEVLRERSRHAA